MLKLQIALDEEIADSEKQIAELQQERDVAVKAGDNAKVAELDKKLKELEEKREKATEKRKRVERVKEKFSLEKFLAGIGKIVLGVVSLLMSDCGGDTKDQKGSGSNDCSDKIGWGLIVSGLKDIGESFDPPAKDKEVEVAVSVEKPRDGGVTAREKSIEQALQKKRAEKMSSAELLKRHPNLSPIAITSEGPVIITQMITDGFVREIVLLDTETGAEVARIGDDSMFTGATNVSNAKISAFAHITGGSMISNGKDTIVHLRGVKLDKSAGAIAIALHPLTFSGKFRAVPSE